MIPGMGRLSRPPLPNSVGSKKKEKSKLKKQINTQTFLQQKKKRKLEKARKKLEQSGQPSLIGKIKSIFTGVGNSILDRDRKTKLQEKVQKMTEKLHQNNNRIKSLQSSKNIVKKEIENINKFRNDKKREKEVTKRLEELERKNEKKTKKNKKKQTNNQQPSNNIQQPQIKPNNTLTKTNTNLPKLNTPQIKQPNTSTKTNLSNTQSQIKPSNNTLTKTNTNLPKLNKTPQIQSNNKTRKNKKYIKGQTQGSTSTNGLSMREKRKEKSELKRIIKGININYNSKGKTYEDILKDYETLKTQSKNTNNMLVLNPRLFNKKSTNV
jgi:hypothetical protein